MVRIELDKPTGGIQIYENNKKCSIILGFKDPTEVINNYLKQKRFSDFSQYTYFRLKYFEQITEFIQNSKQNEKFDNLSQQINQAIKDKQFELIPDLLEHKKELALKIRKYLNVR